MKNNKNVIFVGNPVPEEMVESCGVHNVNIADNIAQNRMIKGLHQCYGDQLTVITVSSEKKQTKQDLGNGLEALTINSWTFNRILYYLSITINYTKKLKEILRVDHSEETVVITAGPYIYMALPVLIARRRHKVKWVPFLVGAVEVPEARFPLSLVSRLSRWTVRRADGAITYVANSAVDYMPKKPFIEIFYQIEEDQMKIYRESKSAKAKKFTITYTGALTNIYNIDTVIEVIKKTGIKYHWVFAGIGQNSEAIKRLSLSKKYDVEYLGAVSNTEAVRLQKSSHLLLCLKGGEHSKVNQYYSKYAASGKLIEYLCSGTPILAADIQGFSAKIKPYMTCEKNQTTNQIVCDIALIEKHYKDKVKLAKIGQQYAFEHCTAHYQNQKIYDFLEEL